MKLLEKQKDSIIIEFSREELRIIHQALNEVLNGISIPELSIRLGAEREEIKALMEHIGHTFRNKL